MRPRRILPALLLAFAWGGAGSAHADERLSLDALSTTTVACQDRLLPGANAHWTYIATRPEALTAYTDGPAGTDFDLALFDRRTGDALASSSGFTAVERATVLLEPGQTVDVQVCRRSGSGRTADLRLDAEALPDAVEDGKPQLVRVALPDGAADAERLNALGLDVTHAIDDDSADVVVYSRGERRQLDDAGFAVETLIADLPADLERTLRRDDRRAGRPTARALPSGRTTYRAFGDYGTDLKDLAEAYPDHVRATTLAGVTLEQRPFEGVEIASDVGRPDDGRPIFLLTGLTHAREWPGGEMAMEFATDLAKTYAAGTDARVNNLVDNARVFVFPMANPDGFMVSRSAGAAMNAGDDTPQATTLPLALNDSGAYKRKNCRAATAADQAGACAARLGLGVDLNRAYSAYWGGAGSSDVMSTQQYRGTGPFTEPEALALRDFAQRHQTQVYITNHTFTEEGRILRQPGFDIPNDEVDPTTPDETRMKALGDAMAAATGGISELGYATLGNITGPADDFFYYSQGTYGYTPELRGTNFHTGYATAVIQEYEGAGATAGRGWREAYLAAGEFAISEADHVVLEGTAPVDATLRLRKEFSLPRSTDTDGDGTQDIDLVTTPEFIDTTLGVRADATFEWHVNPSKRPYGPADEAFTLTCERGGAVVATRTFTAARGERKTFDFADCAAAAPPSPSPSGTPAVSPTTAPGPSVTPTSRPPATPAPTTVSPTTTPPSVERLRVSLRRGRISAARVNRRGRTRVRVVLAGPGALRAVRVRVRDRRGRVLLRGRAGRVTRTQTVRLRRVRPLRAGRLRVVLTARTATGERVRATRRLRVAP